MLLLPTSTSLGDYELGVVEIRVRDDELDDIMHHSMESYYCFPPFGRSCSNYFSFLVSHFFQT